MPPVDEAEHLGRSLYMDETSTIYGRVGASEKRTDPRWDYLINSPKRTLQAFPNEAEHHWRRIKAY